MELVVDPGIETIRARLNYTLSMRACAHRESPCCCSYLFGNECTILSPGKLPEWPCTERQASGLSLCESLAECARGWMGRQQEAEPTGAAPLPCTGLTNLGSELCRRTHGFVQRPGQQ